MTKREALLSFVIVSGILVASCATAPRRPSELGPPTSGGAAPPPTQTPAPAQPSKSAVTSGAESSAPKASAQDNLVQKGKIAVTEAFYEETLTDVRKLIATLNTIIADEDYNSWLTYLTPQYVQNFSDPKTLAELSNMPLLQKEGIELHSLRDYFLNVVVPSRSDARVDDVDFLSKNHVRAIAIINGQRYILYDLRYQEGSWKIGVP